LLIPAGSRLLELEEIRGVIDDFDSSGLVYPWKHTDPRMDMLSADVQKLANDGDRLKRSRTDTFMLIWRAAKELAREKAVSDNFAPKRPARKVPHFTEPWYCCAEPTEDQFVSIASDARPPMQSDTFF
jgi:outer membrane murein-binding lipoprotein Lpp